MLSLSAIALIGALYQADGCPSNFQTTNQTVSAITNSAELLLCVSKAVLFRGSDGKLTLVLNSNSISPKCLIYPNGLSPDLSAQLISSGHTGCWSLYPPSQPVAITNIGTPTRVAIAKALAKFRPTQPRIIYYPKSGFFVGKTVEIWPSSKSELQRCTMLGLQCQIRFTPKTYRWVIDGNLATQAKQSLVLSETGQLAITLSVGFSVEYRFVELTSWRSVKPNVIANAIPVNLLVTGKDSPVLRHVPRLVDKPCTSGQSRFGC